VPIAASVADSVSAFWVVMMMTMMMMMVVVVVVIIAHLGAYLVARR